MSDRTNTYKLYQGSRRVVDTWFASGAPGVDDGIKRNFVPGSVWCTLTKRYICVVNTAGAAVWVPDAQFVMKGTWVSNSTTTEVNALTVYKGNLYIGILAQAATTTLPSADPTHWTLLTDNLTGVIADPGASGAIAVTKSGTCPLVTATAETRTLAIPTFVGQEIVLSMKTDGGDCVVTVASAFNQTGNNTITFNDVGDTVRLFAVDKSGTLCWRLSVNDGATLSTV